MPNANKDIENMNPDELVARLLETENPTFWWSSTFGFNVPREKDAVKDKLATLLIKENKGQVPPTDKPFTSDQHAMDYIIEQRLNQAREKNTSETPS